MRRPGRRADERGASAIELAVIAPALLVLIFFSIQVALWLFGRNVAEQSAREAVSRLRVIVVGSDLPSALAAAQVEAENYARSVGGESMLDPVATATLSSPTRVRVSVTGRAISLVPGVTLTVSGSAEGDVEQFQVDR